MKHEELRKLTDYLFAWARFKDLQFTYTNDFSDEKDETGALTYENVEKTYLTIKNKAHTTVCHMAFEWTEMSPDIYIMAKHIIKRVEESLERMSAGYKDTDDIKPWDDISTLYPKSMIMFPEEHRAYMQHVKTKMNSIYGAGNYCYGMSRANGKSMYQSELWKSFIESRCNSRKLPFIQDVIFNDPATIVFWKDGTKTVVKAQDGEEYDPEKGLAMAISKKAMGNNRNYYLTFKKYLKKYDEQYPELPQISFEEAMKRAGEVTKELAFGVSNKKRKKDNVK